MAISAEDTRKLTAPSVSVSDSFTEELYGATTDNGVGTRWLLTQIAIELKIMNLYFSEMTGNIFNEEDII